MTLNQGTSMKQDWISSLHSQAEDERYQAVAKLLAGRCYEVAPSLTELLRDRSEAVCCAALVALAELGGPECLEPLHELALHDQSESVRRRAIWALGYRGDPSSTSVLRTILTEDSPLRRDAARALSRIEPEKVWELTLTQTERDAQERDRRELAELISTFRFSQDPDEKNMATQSLSQIAQTAGRFPELLEPLLDALEAAESPDDENAAYAVEGLVAQALKLEPQFTERVLRALPAHPGLAPVAGHWKLQEAVPILLGQAESANRYLAVGARKALAQLDDPSACHQVQKLLLESGVDNASRSLAADFLGRHGGQDGREALCKVLPQCDPCDHGELLRAVARGLAYQGASEALPSLLRAYKASQPANQKRKPTDFLARHDVEEYFYELCRDLLETLGQFKDPRVEALLLGELDSPHAGVRCSAARALAGFPGAASQRALEKACRDPQPRVSAAARQSLP